MALFTQHFADVPDPRTKELCDHVFLDIVAIAILGCICGAEGWDDLADFGEAKKAWLQTFLELPNGIPSADTFQRVFSSMLPGPFRKAFVAWMQTLVGATNGTLVALDGKTARRSFRKASEGSPLHVVRAWSAKNHLVLGQVATDTKSNEITALPKLLDLLSLEGAVVTIDAMGTQKAIAAKIVEKGADYVLVLKENHPTLYAEVEQAFAGAEDGTPAVACTKYEAHEKGHGRTERRRVWTTMRLEDVPSHKEWEGLASISRVDRTFTDGTGKTSSETRYVISSLSTTARRMAELVRGHWGIENGCHWVLDVAMREDESRIHAGFGAENFALVRNVALNLLKQEKTKKRGVAAKRKICGWDQDYLLRVLSGEI